MRFVRNRADRDGCGALRLVRCGRCRREVTGTTTHHYFTPMTAIARSIYNDIPAWIVRGVIIAFGGLTFGYVVFWSDDHNDARYIKQMDWKREHDRVLDAQKEHAERIVSVEHAQRSNELTNMSVAKDLSSLKEGQGRLEKHVEEALMVLKSKP
jgi:hypothetical protein